MAPGAKRGQREEADLESSAAREQRTKNPSLVGRQRPVRDDEEIDVAEGGVEAAEGERAMQVDARHVPCERLPQAAHEPVELVLRLLHAASTRLSQ
jgi:hypothetical protein